MNHEVLSRAFSPAWALLGDSRASAFPNPHSEHPSSLPWPAWSTESGSVQRLPAACPASPPRRPLQPPTGPGRTSAVPGEEEAWLGRPAWYLRGRGRLPSRASPSLGCDEGEGERAPVSIIPGTCSRHFVPASWRPFREGTHLGVIPNSFQLQPQTPPLSGPLGSPCKVRPDSGHPPHLHGGRPPLPPGAPEDHRLPSPVTVRLRSQL